MTMTRSQRQSLPMSLSSCRVFRLVFSICALPLLLVSSRQQPYLRQRADNHSRQHGTTNLIDFQRNVLQPASALRWRRLTTLATTKCNNIRQDTYLAELQLSYSYEAEFAAGGSRSLIGVKDALVQAVVEALDDCDNYDQPMYQVRTNGKHEFSRSGYCVPMAAGNTCSVVNGTTLVLLDSGSAVAQQKALSAIENALADTNSLHNFASSVVRAKFLQSTRESLVIAPTEEPDNGDGGETLSTVTVVAAASASLLFVVAAIFCYGFIRRQRLRSSNPSIRYGFKRRRLSSATLVSPMGISARRKQPFFPLDENPSVKPPFPVDALPPARFDISAGQYMSDTTEGEEDYNEYEQQRRLPASTNWSISDITSDSESIMSGLSRTTSKLERIEEADDESGSWEDGSSSYQPRKRMHRREESDADLPIDLHGGDPANRRTVELYDGEYQDQSEMELSTEYDFATFNRTIDFDAYQESPSFVELEVVEEDLREDLRVTSSESTDAKSDPNNRQSQTTEDEVDERSISGEGYYPSSDSSDDTLENSGETEISLMEGSAEIHLLPTKLDAILEAQKDLITPTSIVDAEAFFAKPATMDAKEKIASDALRNPEACEGK